MLTTFLTRWLRLMTSIFWQKNHFLSLPTPWNIRSLYLLIHGGKGIEKIQKKHFPLNPLIEEKPESLSLLRKSSKTLREERISDIECDLFSLCPGYELCRPDPLPQPLVTAQSPRGHGGAAYRNSHARLLCSLLTSIIMIWEVIYWPLDWLDWFHWFILWM